MFADVEIKTINSECGLPLLLKWVLGMSMKDMNFIKKIPCIIFRENKNIINTAYL